MSKRRVIIPEIQEIARKAVANRLKCEKLKKTKIKDVTKNKLTVDSKLAKFKFLCGGNDDTNESN